MKKFISIVLLGVLLVSNAVLCRAENPLSVLCEFDSIKREMRISGGNEALPGGTPVQITVYYPGHTPEGIMSGEYGLSDAICYMAETEAEDKAYSFAPFRLKDTAVRGSYLIIVNAENIGAGRTEYYYTPISELKGVLNSVNSASAETLFNTVISNADILMIDASEYSEFDTERKAYVGSALADNDYSAADEISPEETDKILKRLQSDFYTAGAAAQIVCAKSAAQVEQCLEKYNDVYGLDLSAEGNFGVLSAEAKSAVYKRLADMEYTTVETFKTAFEKVTVLSAVTFSKWGAVRAALEKYNSYFEIDLENFDKKLTQTQRDSVYKQMIGVEFSDYADVKARFTKLCSEIGSSSNSGGGLSGGSSGSGRGGNTSHIGLPSVLTPDSGTEDTQIYSDLDGYDWARGSILRMTEKGILSGKGEGIFDPESPVTREEFVKMLVLALFPDETGTESPYSDVDASMWSFPYIAAANRLGLVYGFTDGGFHPKDRITRQDMAVMLYRAAQKAQLELKSKKEAEFNDSEAIDGYAKEAVNALCSAQVINGDGSGNFAPKEYATRAQSAKMLDFMINK